MSTDETAEPVVLRVEDAAMDPVPTKPRKSRGRKARAVAFITLHVLGVILAIDAVMATRTAQGAIAWSVALVAIPVVAVPAYLVLGRQKFHGYVESRRENQAEIQELRREYLKVFPEAQVISEDPRLQSLQTLVPFFLLTAQNDVELLIDGEQTFDSIFAGIEEAREYLLVEFYIVRDDGLGRRLRSAMIDKARHGVRVYFLYDEVGSSGLPKSFNLELEEAGVEVSTFNTRQGVGNRFQLNFRNHRKIVVVDGRLGWVGGHNVGDEYLGLDPEVGFWRDTHVRVEGPSVIDLQRTFLADWYWATRRLPELAWEPVPAASGADVVTLGLPTGPSDEFETAGLLFADLIQQARRRLWIATPYFVPDRAVVAALQLAGLRGVDVRVLIPAKGDSKLVELSAYSFVEEFARSGIRFFRNEKGFLHHKVMLVDDDISVVGTANLDNRSFRLNFEFSQVVVDEAFASEMEAMFEEDFANARRVAPEVLGEQSFLFRLAVRVSRLMAPLQ